MTSSVAAKLQEKLDFLTPKSDLAAKNGKLEIEVFMKEYNKIYSRISLPILLFLQSG